MKRTKKALNFICFYLTLPLFIFTVLATGVKALDVPNTYVNYDASYDIEEYEVLPSYEIEGEIQNPKGSYPIVAKDLSKDYNILNSTNEQINEEELASTPLPHQSTNPVVLVVHTHGTECYSNSNESFESADVNGNYGFYTDTSLTRTSDTDKNVVAIGEAFCQVLAENGIQSIQCRVMHDIDDYNSAYSNSRNSIKEYLEKYPSIEYVIDIHRDSLGGEGGEKIKTSANSIEGSAQVMLVAGCHGNGVIYPCWKDNLALALQYKKVMDKKYPSLSRPIYLRYSRYNLDLTVGSMLLEIGSCANTFNEALKAARLSAECFAELLKQEIDIS